MFDMDGDGDIDEFDDEMIEYELQLMEDEMMFEDEEMWGNKRPYQKEDLRKSCGLGVLITLGFFVLIFIALLGI